MGNTAAKIETKNPYAPVAPPKAQAPPKVREAHDPDPLRPSTGPRRDCGCSWHWECSCKRVDPRCPIHSSGPGMWCNCVRVDCPINPHYETDKAVAKAQSAAEARQAPSAAMSLSSSDPSIAFVNQAIANLGGNQSLSLGVAPMTFEEELAAVEKAASATLPAPRVTFETTAPAPAPTFPQPQVIHRRVTFETAAPAPTPVASTVPAFPQPQVIHRRSAPAARPHVIAPAKTETATTSKSWWKLW